LLKRLWRQHVTAYSMISTITYGIFSFGVPHLGSRHATWGRIAGRIIGISADQLNKSFLNSIKSGSAYNEILNVKFEPLLERYRFFSFCETLPEEVNGKDFGIVGLDLFLSLWNIHLTKPDCRQRLSGPREVKIFLTAVTELFASSQVLSNLNGSKSLTISIMMQSLLLSLLATVRQSSSVRRCSMIYLGT
jgi:hypothetical protein